MALPAKLQGSWELLKASGSGFMQHKVLKLSASLAYYTVFSIGPMLLVVLFFTNLVWQRQAVEGTLYKQMSGLVGSNVALQIQEIIKNASLEGSSFKTIISFVALVIAATTLFVEMQDSLNMIWNLRVKASRSGWLRVLRTRLVSFSVTAGLAFLLLVSLIINSLLDGFMDKLQQHFPQIGFVAVYVLNQVLSIFITALLFGIIYKVLPDAVISWKDVAVGSVFTSVLFLLGKYGITLYISKGNPASAYGSAGSLVILLLWVYYSAVILYFGAEFTKAYALKYGTEIRPKDYAVTVQTAQVESREKSIQDNERHVQELQRKMQPPHSKGTSLK